MYPALLKLAGSRCVVVGGGVVAARKVADLLRCGALVRAVSPEWRTDFSSLQDPADRTRLVLITRPFQEEDIDGALLVVAATDDRAVQNLVAAEAARRGIPCNVVDVNELSSFYVPATLRRGSLTVSVGTEGKSPLFAVLLRDRLASVIGARTSEGLERLGRGREIVRAWSRDDPARRRAALRRLVTPEAVEDILADRMEAFERHWEGWLGWLDSQKG
jgi:precorrin-2 dehydrogenase/sirohydrochlorin ferrochelatase